MGVRLPRLLLLTAALALFPMPALACSPMLSVASGAILIGWLLWLVIGLIFIRRPFVRSDVRYWWYIVPVGFFCWTVPTLGFLMMPIAVLYLAWPAHLTIEFFMTLGGYPSDGAKADRLLFFGVPLASILILGTLAKYQFYARNGGLRQFMWNHFGEHSYGFFALFFGIGLTTLILAQMRAAKSATR